MFDKTNGGNVLWHFQIYSDGAKSEAEGTAAACGTACGAGDKEKPCRLAVLLVALVIMVLPMETPK